MRVPTEASTSRSGARTTLRSAPSAIATTTPDAPKNSRLAPVSGGSTIATVAGVRRTHCQDSGETVNGTGGPVLDGPATAGGRRPSSSGTTPRCGDGLTTRLTTTSRSHRPSTVVPPGRSPWSGRRAIPAPPRRSSSTASLSPRSTPAATSTSSARLDRFGSPASATRPTASTSRADATGRARTVAPSAWSCHSMMCAG